MSLTKLGNLVKTNFFARMKLKIEIFLNTDAEDIVENVANKTKIVWEKVKSFLNFEIQTFSYKYDERLFTIRVGKRTLEENKLEYKKGQTVYIKQISEIDVNAWPEFPSHMEEWTRKNNRKFVIGDIGSAAGHGKTIFSLIGIDGFSPYAWTVDMFDSFSDKDRKAFLKIATFCTVRKCKECNIHTCKLVKKLMKK